MKYRSYVFTWNNYDEHTIKRLDDIYCRYVCYGKEVAPTTGTRHLQGFIFFVNPRSEVSVRKELEGAHVEPAKGSAEQCIAYCSKDGDFHERGSPPLEKGKAGGALEQDRWKRARMAAEEGRFEDVPDDLFIRYRNTFEQIRLDAMKPEKQEIEVFKPWQEQLMSEMFLPAEGDGARATLNRPDSRKIIWFVDERGGAGKTTFAKYLQYHTNALLLENNRSADVNYLMAQKRPRVVIFDFPKETEEKVNYGVMQSVKNGQMFSSKYECRVVSIPIPWVLVFSNFHPDVTKMSADRWDIRILN